MATKLCRDSNDLLIVFKHHFFVVAVGVTDFKNESVKFIEKSEALDAIAVEVYLNSFYPAVVKCDHVLSHCLITFVV